MSSMPTTDQPDRVHVESAPLPVTRPRFGPEEVASVAACLESGWVTQGVLTRRFEAAFAERHAVPHALATTSCTAALHLSALALELGPGDEVIVPAFTWVTSAHLAEYVGARAVFADIDENTFHLDPAAVEAALTPRTRGMVIVHLFGLAAPMRPLLELARRHNLAVIEDAACAVGTTYDETPVGGFGDFGCFSFHPRKIMTTGEGGMVTTRRDDLVEKVQSLRNHGAGGSPGADTGPTRPWSMGRFDRLGYNLRFPDILGAVGLVQIQRLDDLLRERRDRADRYTALLEDLSDIQRPSAPPPCGHTYQSYVIMVREGGLRRRNAIMEALETDGVQTRPGTHAVPRLGYYRDKYGLRAGQFPRSEQAEDHSITLPLFPGMTDEDQDRVIAALSKALSARVG